MLDPFLRLFQKSEPLIHQLYDFMMKMLQTMLLRFLKREAVHGKTLTDLQTMDLTIKNIQLDNENIEIGCDTRMSLKHLSSQAHNAAIDSMRLFYQKTSTHLLKKLPFKSVLKHCRCLQPQVLNEKWTIESIKELDKCITLDPVLSPETVCDEWRILQTERIPVEWHTEVNEDGESKHKRVDYFWREIFSLQDPLHDQTRYPELTRLVKAVLVLSHGNAETERGFSQVSNFLTDSRTLLSAASISALQSTKDGLKQYNNKCHTVPITEAFLTKGRHARKNYHLRLAEENRIKEEKILEREQQEQKAKKELEEEEKRKKELEKTTAQSKLAFQLEKDLRGQEEQNASESC